MLYVMTCDPDAFFLTSLLEWDIRINMSFCPSLISDNYTLFKRVKKFSLFDQYHARTQGKS